MTEKEWLECSDPLPMLGFLQGKVSERKLRLFAVACCRWIWALLTCEPQGPQIEKRPILLGHERRILQDAQRHLDTAEQYADSLVTPYDVLISSCDIHALLMMRRPQDEPWSFALVALLRATATEIGYYGTEWEDEHFDALKNASDAFKYVVNVANGVGLAENKRKEMQQRSADILRCIFASLFRPVTIDARWLSSTPLDLAQVIYDGSAFDGMPILADALMDAGCDNEEIIAHCRSDGPHVRGCWVVDLLMGKK